jgi:hypothetical protein
MKLVLANSVDPFGVPRTPAQAVYTGMTIGRMLHGRKAQQEKEERGVSYEDDDDRRRASMVSDIRVLPREE